MSAQHGVNLRRSKVIDRFTSFAVVRLKIENRRAPLGRLIGAKPLCGDFRAILQAKSFPYTEGGRQAD